MKKFTFPTIAVQIAWTLGADDYDLCIHKRNLDGSDGDLVSSSATGAPGTSENTTINPGATPPPGGGVTPQAMQPGPQGEQVTDFAYDQDSGLLAVAPEPRTVDIISIKYQTRNTRRGPGMMATMKVSDLATIPPSTTWRMYLTASAPELGVVNISGNSYSKGLSDDGDQFFLQASTDPSSVVSYSIP